MEFRKTLFFTLPLLILQAVCFGQDIVITSVTGPTTAPTYTKLPNAITIKNTGIVDIADYIYVDVYLSTDNVLSKNSDILVSTTSVKPLAVGISSTFGIPYWDKYVTPGTYYLIVVADDDGMITETDETNNLFVVPNYVITAADVNFTFDSFSLDKTSCALHDIITPSFVIKNTGSTKVQGNVYTEFYLSSDAIYSTDDLELGNTYTDLTSFTNRSDFALTVPAVAVGTYYIIAVTDKLGSHSYFNETNETDNVLSQSINIKASDIDLEIKSVGAIFPGSEPNFNIITFELKNNGTTGVSGFKMYPSLSSAPHIELDPFPYVPQYEQQSGSEVMGNDYIGPGESKIFSMEIWNYNFTPQPDAGFYFLTLTVNRYNEIEESNYANNIFYANYPPYEITPPPIPSVSLVNLTTTGSYDNTDKSLSFNLNLLNTGTAVFYPAPYILTISNSSNAIVYSKSFSVPINYTNESSSYDINVSLSNALPVGQYKVEVKCDGSCSTTPNSKIIDLNIQQVQYQLTGTVEGEDGTPLTKGNLFLYEKGDNGKVTFVQSATLTTSNTFTFQLDEHEHTLYFIPDVNAFGSYVPTVYGKTVLLQPSSFFKATGDMNVTFEVLKIQPLPTGPGIISGSISTSTPSGRLATGTLGILPSYPIILLSSSDKAVGYTSTDDNGFFEFRNLPRDTYKIVVAAELDKAVMTTPYGVDITHQNSTITIALGTTGAVLNTTPLLLNQTIALTLPSSTTYGIGSINFSASSDSSLPVTLISSDPSVAEIAGNKIVIRGAGRVVISASQAGNSFYKSGHIDKELVINKASQILSLVMPSSVTYGVGTIDVSASADTNLPVALSSSDPTVASVVGNRITIRSGGKVIISASQSGNAFYDVTHVDKELVINRASQTISLNMLQSVRYGIGKIDVSASANSSLPVSLTSSDISVAEIVGNKIVIHSGGKVIISASQAGNASYNPANTNKELVVSKGAQLIFFDNIPEKKTTDQEFDLKATASSLLEVTFTSGNDKVIKIDKNKGMIMGPGSVLIVASQAGDKNYESANSVTHLVVVKEIVTGLENVQVFQLYPNPVKNILVIKSDSKIDKIELVDISGKSYVGTMQNENQVDMTTLSSGVYALRLFVDGKFQTLKVVKE